MKYNTINNNDILKEIYNMIDNRKHNPIDNSYTNYLLDQGLDKICKKVGEEATETVIAAKNENKDELVGEICDVIYHILVLMYYKNVKISDIKQKLSERHKIECNKKKPNKRGDY